MTFGKDEALSIQVDRLDERTLEISATGSLDESTVADLRTEAHGHGDDAPNRLLIDLSGLDNIDAAGLAALLLARIEVEARGGMVAVWAGKPRLERALERAGLRRFVNVASTRADALRLLTPA